MVDNKENYILDLGVKGLNKEIYDTIFTFSQKVSLTKKNNQPWPGWWNRHNFLPIFLFGFFAHLLQTKVKWHKKSNTGTQSSQSSQRIVHSQLYHLSENTTQVNSAFHVRWFICWEAISKYYSLPSRQRDKINF